MTMTETDLLHALSELEQQLSRITEAVNLGEAQALETSSAALRQSALTLLAAIDNTGADSLHVVLARRRLKQLAVSLAIQRAGLMRRAALVEQTLQAMVPGAMSQTYAPVPSPYGSVRKQTGAFSSLAA
jgi:hypothetical protein